MCYKNNIRKFCEYYFFDYLCRKLCEMEIIFEKEYLKKLFYEGKTSDKKHRFQPQIIRRYIRAINVLDSVERVEDLLKFHSLNYEKQKGEKEGLESVRVNHQYRIEFKSSFKDNEKTITICNIIELSNHYNK